MKAWYARRRHWIVPLAWVLGAWVAWWVFFGAPERARNRAINPAVFQAFRYIEGHCAREVFPNETVRCQAALRAMAECTAKIPPAAQATTTRSYLLLGLLCRRCILGRKRAEALGLGG